MYIAAADSQHTIEFYRRKGAQLAEEVLLPFDDDGSTEVDAEHPFGLYGGDDIQLVLPLTD
jgi:hypothetical protein